MTASIPRICVFDVNGTLTDQSALDPLFGEVFGFPEARRLWFRTVLHTSTATTLRGDYQPFAIIFEQTLHALAAQLGRPLFRGQIERVATAIRELPLHADVLPGLLHLKDNGYRIAALTNSAAAAAQEQFTQTGVADLFETVLSCDEVKAAKPSPKPYRHAAERLGVAPGDLWLVAAHAWDTSGAMAAGLNTALVLRPDQHGWTSCDREPTVRGHDVLDAARALIAWDQSSRAASP